MTAAPPTPAPGAAEPDEVAALRQRLAKAEADLAEARRNIESAVGHANRVALEAEIAAIETRQLLNVSHDALWVVDSNYHVVRANDAMAALVGQKAHALHGKTCSEVFSYGLCGTPHCPVARLREGGDVIEVDVESAQPSGRAFIASMAPYYGIDGDVYGVVASFKDITDRKKAEAELARLATRDGLTGLCNRRHFDATLENESLRARRERTPLSLIMSDVDHFKQYNDTYGHQAGDQCLREVARALQGAMRRPADLAARYGGEEFVAVLPATPREGAAIVAEAVRAAVAALGIPHAKSSAAAHVTISLGCATLVPGSDETTAALLVRADQALYQAKHSGRNRVLAAPDLAG